MKKRMLQQSAGSSARKFYNRISEDKFKDNFVKRQPLLEKGFMFKQGSFMGFDEEIVTMIETHGWEIFCYHPDDAYPKLVRDFDSHISTDSPFQYVRGISVLCDADKINDFSVTIT